MGNRIGVVGLPDLARHLDGVGFEVVTGDGFRGAAMAVREAVRSGERLPVLVADTVDHTAPPVSVEAWVAGASRSTAVVVVRLRGASGYAAPNHVVAPAPLTEILAAAGAVVHLVDAAAHLNDDGSITVPLPPASSQDDTDDADALDWSAPNFTVGTTGHDAPDSDEAVGPAPRRGDIVVCFSGKGGVGKTTMAEALAQMAATLGPEGFRASLVDGNRGQGDVRTYLRLAQAPIATVYDAVMTGDPASALVPPHVLEIHRHPGLERVDFALAAAPHEHVANERDVPASAYRAVIEHARSVSDLVVVDTQIFEASDTSGLWDELFLPLLMNGAWGLAITDSSSPGLTNLLSRLRALATRGVPADHLMWGVNRADAADHDLVAEYRKYVGTTATYVGTSEQDPQVDALMKNGHLPIDVPDVRRLGGTALARITGLDHFVPVEAAAPTKRRGGLFGWLR